ncbi:potassium channel family protein [Chryseobacterium sp. PS-8]|uniref:Potassium channel family protein n=1 Tax=Chryseobacterium indicum TaxID=2766954 RepID=A0ABS9C4F5_9FLAO|nr:potassium channel family protein [Chryseobacterium sp. PS-8]MCF2219452.1 potassium channel family protein [Chryseobacterium sp. PS-8]
MKIRYFLKKLFFGKDDNDVQLGHTAVKNQAKNLKRVWNNEKHDDIGLEKILRLFLVAVQFIFPGIYVRNYFGKKSLKWKNLAVELYVLVKVTLPLLCLLFDIYKLSVIIFITFYLLIETILYVATLIFVSDMFAKPRSYRRSVLLLFFNYIEIVFDFAVIYGGLELLGGNITSITDYIYFSFVTSATIGFGDICPTTDLGKWLVIIQSMIFIIFVVLFLNFFTSRVEHHHYYDENDKC